MSDGRLGRIGLCSRCRHVRPVRNDRGSIFIRCGLAATDPTLARYPQLPVIDCHGFQLEEGDARDESAPMPGSER